MRARRIGITHAVDQGHLAIVVQLLERRHRRMQSEMVVDLEDLLLADAQVAVASVVVVPVGIGHHAVHIVVAARQLDDDNDGILASGRGGHGWGLSVLLRVCLFLAGWRC